MAVSKKVRFEVFQRDAFTCQYCGRKAPDVVLYVDHFIPVAVGGTDDMHNLKTACESCNSGKSDKSIPVAVSGVPLSMREAAAFNLGFFVAVDCYGTIHQHWQAARRDLDDYMHVLDLNRPPEGLTPDDIQRRADLRLTAWVAFRNEDTEEQSRQPLYCRNANYFRNPDEFI